MGPWLLGALALAGALIGLVVWAGPPKQRKTAEAASASARLRSAQPLAPVVLPQRGSVAAAEAAHRPATRPPGKPARAVAAKPVMELAPRATRPDASAAEVQRRHELTRRRMQHQEELNRLTVAIADAEAMVARKEDLPKSQVVLDGLRERAAAVRRSLAIIRQEEKA